MYKWIVVLFCAFFAACGGGGGSGGTDDSGSVSSSASSDTYAKVGLVFTDATSQEYKSAEVTFTKAELVGDDGRVTLFSGEQTLDLLKLPDFYEFVDTAEVPPGDYQSVWITATKVTLTTEDDSGNDVVKEAKLPSGVIKVLSKSGFSVAPGDVLFLEIDFDMNKALKLTETGNGKIILRPVVFANIYSQPPRDKFIRLHGVVENIEGLTFDLCQTQLITDSVNPLSGSEEHCFNIVTDEATGIFGSSGLPLEEDLQEGDSITVIGRLSAMLSSLPDIPNGQLPPPGMCRIWYLDLEPGQQLAPVDCDDIDAVPENAVVIGHEGLKTAFLFSVHAYTIEEGPLTAFSRYSGLVMTPVDEISSQFEFDVDDGQGIDATSSLPVQLFEKTRIFSDDGMEMGIEDVTAGRSARIDAVFSISDTEPDVLRSPFVLLAGDAEDQDMLEGTVVTLDELSGMIEVQTESLETVIVDAGEARVFLITDSESAFSSEEISLSEAPVGTAIEAFGEEDELSGNFIAEVVFIKAE
ncbi:hypothetical protein BTA51_02675 [Hahella sp. CCB-MM4]|uniref:DUF4382 domain-containing protein n=1 Tax=Hahella sp. (strain CCB-MM4) TaxID=1926491 RepID=UPI000B9C467F|nr:DUF4382 domain-containing protein [Hahella sp. CCB-MM4]OZG75308.1 hypothetical protein BTA51_02675 [Hahella sp. CCB-MM4]